MQSQSVFFREDGFGPGIVCLHSNASSSSQWRSLMDMLAPRFHVLAADSYGAGKSPSWPGNRVIGLRDEVALINPVFDRAGESGIREAVADALVALQADDTDAAARHFIDYWMGPGTWDHMPERNKAAISRSIINIGGWETALFGEPTPLKAFAKLDIPVLYMTGKQSPPDSLGVARLLTAVLPRVEIVEFEKLGHMGPVTHPDVVNEKIVRFLERDEGRATFDQT